MECGGDLFGGPVIERGRRPGDQAFLRRMDRRKQPARLRSRTEPPIPFLDRLRVCRAHRMDVKLPDRERRGLSVRIRWCRVVRRRHLMRLQHGEGEMHPPRNPVPPMIGADPDAPARRRRAVLHQPVPVGLGNGDGIRIGVDELRGHGRHGAPCGDPFLCGRAECGPLALNERDEMRLCLLLEPAEPRVVAGGADDPHLCTQGIASLQHRGRRGGGAWSVYALRVEVMLVHLRRHEGLEPIAPDVLARHVARLAAEDAGAGRRPI